MNLHFQISPQIRLAIIFAIGITLGGITIHEALKLPQWDIDLKVGDKLSTFVVEENDLITEPSEIISNIEAKRFYERQDELDAILKKKFSQKSRTRSLSDLGILFWIPMIVGLGSFFIAGGIWSIRLNNLAADFFAFSGLALCVSALSSAIYTTRSFALPSEYFLFLESLNAWGATLFAMSMIALFIVYPKPMNKAKMWIALEFFIFSVWTYLFIKGALPDWGHITFIVMVELLIIALMIAIQFIRFNKDPEARASLIWIGLSVVLGAGAYVALNILPNLFDYKSLDQGIGFIFFLMIYAGIAAGISKYRLFEVGEWAFRFFFYGLGSLFLVLIDGILIYGMGLGRVPSLGAAVFIVSLIYLPFRDSLARRWYGQNKLGVEETLKIALNVAFAPNSLTRIEKWKSSLSEIFHPLQLEVVSAEASIVSIENNGISLLVPAVADLPAVRISYANSGKQLFTHKAEKLVDQLVILIREAELSRSAYNRGVSEERQRVAQDLHDDVGARLLSGLYAADEKSKFTFQAAIADIRTIVSGMSGSKTTLSKLFADLRYETLRRLEVAQVECRWDMESVANNDLILEFELQRAISSVVREMTSNVVRHANATLFVVRVLIEHEQVFIFMADDGKGMAPENIDGTQQGHGLKILKMRVEKLKGSIRFHSDCNGTKADVWFPIC